MSHIWRQSGNLTKYHQTWVPNYFLLFFPGNFQLFCPTTNKWVFSWLWSPQFFSICWLRSIPKDLVNHVTFPNWVKPSRHRNPTAKEFFFLPIFLHRPHPRTNSGNKIRNLSVEPARGILRLTVQKMVLGQLNISCIGVAAAHRPRNW